MNNFIKRTITGILLLAAVILSLKISTHIHLVAVFIIALLSSIELSFAFKHMGVNYPLKLQIILGLVYFIMIYFKKEYFLLLLFVFQLAIIIAVLGHKYDLKDMSFFILSFIYVFINFSILILIKEKKYIYLIYMSSWSTDTFAYLFGSLLGKRKLIERISPNKSVEGAIFGTIFSSLSTTILAYFLGINNLFIWFFVFLISSIFAQLGDLVASYIKRSAKIKDFSHILLGHGGILDRFDSILFVAPIIFIFINY